MLTCKRIEPDMMFKAITSKRRKELAWRNGSVMDCHAKTRGSIPGGNVVKTELYVLRKGEQMGVPSLNDLAVDWT